MVARKFIVALALSVAVAGAAASAGEILTNEMINKMIQEGVTLDVILQKISTSSCRLDDSSAAITEVQKSGKAGNWKAEDISKLQIKFMEVAGMDKKRLKEMVLRSINIFENADVNEYDLEMRKLVKEGRMVVPYLLEHVEQESERKRSGVVDALGRLGDNSDSVVRAVTLMLFDRAKPVRAEAAKCVASLAGPKTCEDLITRLASKNDKLDGVALALGYLGDPKAVDALVKVLKLSGDSDTRVCAAFSLGRLRARTPAATDALLEAVLDEYDEKLRDNAAQSLALIGDGRTPSHVIRAFQRYRQGREDIIRHLRYFKSGEGVEFLLEQIDNDNPKVKKVALETLRILSGENYEASDEWRSWWEVNKVRPDWQKATNTERPRVPDARSSLDGTPTEQRSLTSPAR